MSRYAYLVCDNTKTRLWLGKAVFHLDGSINHFAAGPAEGPRNSLQDERTRALWKFIADSAGHSLKVVLEGGEEYPSMLSYREIGGSTDEDIPFGRYLEDWMEQ